MKIMTKKTSSLDEVFALLETSESLKEKASMDPSTLDKRPSVIINEAADNKFHACTLIKEHIRTATDEKVKSFLRKQFESHENEAIELRQKSEELKRREQEQEQNQNAGISQRRSFDENHLHSVDWRTRDEMSVNARATKPIATDATYNHVATLADRQLSAAMDEDKKGDLDEATDMYIKAAKLYRKAVKMLSDSDIPLTRGGIETSESHSESDKSIWEKKIKLINDQVQKLKEKKELDVLVKSSQVTAGLFYPWSDEKANAYDFSPPQSFVDPDGRLQLSDEQKARFYTWARPHEIARMRSLRGVTMINTMSPYTIKQHCVSDCSFIAGLCIAADYESRLGRRLVSSLLYPQDSNGTPIYNDNGVYMIKLWLNGVARRVIVDDYLPIDKEGNLLCSHTAVPGEGENTLELWVPILEKAYMKMCGSYNFAGSNSGVDLFSLTGWIPEKIHFPEDSNSLKDHETTKERCWERLSGASSSNDCLITMATSKDLTEEQANSVGLHTDHAYAVLKMKEQNGNRLLQLKNPWGHSTQCTKFFRGDECEGGVFWIDWDNVTKYLRNIHVSWNPDLFRYKEKTHALWKVQDGPKDDLFNVSQNPQYIVKLSRHAIQKNATLWVLLSRHVTEQEQKGNMAEEYKLAADIHRIQKAGQRVYYPNGDSCIVVGGYTSNQHILIRYDVKGPEDRLLSIVLRQFNKSSDLMFTFSSFCTEDFDLIGQPAKEMALHMTLRGKWQLRDDSNKRSLQIGSAGGPAGSGSFGSNPQWCITVRRSTKLQFKCFARKELAVNVVLVRTTGRRVHHLYEWPVVDTGPYRYGFSVSSVVSVPPGKYNLVASNAQAGETGSFEIQLLSSSANIEVECI